MLRVGTAAEKFSSSHPAAHGRTNGEQVLVNLYLRLAFLIVVTSFAGVSQAEFVVQDTEFDPGDWGTTVLQSSNATHSFTQQPTGGNPGAFRFMSHSMSGSAEIIVFHESLAAPTYDPALEGEIVSVIYSEDRVQFDPPFSGAQITGKPAIRQDGKVYVGPRATYTTQSWEQLSLEDLTAADFVEFGGSQIPDFSEAGSPIHFGFLRSNTTCCGADTEHGIDNWRFEVVSSPPILPVTVYFTEQSTANRISRRSEDGTLETLINLGTAVPEGLAIDPRLGVRLYWTVDGAGEFTSDDKTQRANLDGSNVETLDQGDPFRGLEDIVLDLVNDKMCWTDPGSSSSAVYCADLDGMNREGPLGPAIDSHGLALDVPSNHMYLSDLDNGTIERRNLDGTGSFIVYEPADGIVRPEGVALDLAASQIYFTDRTAGKIYRGSLDGSEPLEELVSGLTSPAQIDLDVSLGKMYFTDYDAGRIYEANLDGSELRPVAEQLDHPQDVVVQPIKLPRSLIWTEQGATERIARRRALDGGVELIAQLSPAVPEGVAIDTISEVIAEKLYWTVDGAGELTSDDKTQRANLDGSNVETLDQGDPFRGLEDIALDLVNDKMYWTDPGGASSAAYRANLDGSARASLGPSIDSHGLALDVPSNHMYLSDLDNGTIERRNLDGTGSFIVYEPADGIVRPEGVALDLAASQIYFTDRTAGKIYRGSLDGSAPLEELVSGLTSPAQIDLDVSLGKMYFTDYDAGRIYEANLDGSELRPVVDHLDHPQDVALPEPGLVPMFVVGGALLYGMHRRRGTKLRESSS